MPNGAPKPTAVWLLAEDRVDVRLGVWRGARLTHEAPVSKEEELGHRVERNVVARALGVVVRAGELRASRVETTAGDSVGHSGHAHGGSGKHLELVSMLDALQAWSVAVL